MTKLHDDPQIKDLVRRLRSAFDPCTIHLFGLRVTGETHFERQGSGQKAQ